MIPKPLSPKQAINKAFLKQKPSRAEVEAFRDDLQKLLRRMDTAESEEFHKNLLSDFLKDTYYKKSHFINTKGRNDLVIHNGPVASAPVGVIIEAKKPTNTAEMPTPQKLNSKALHELLLYYLRERITHKNSEIRHLIITNLHEWFIFDASVFEKLFTQNNQLLRQFADFEEGRLADTKTSFFYQHIAAPFIAGLAEEVPFTYFNLSDFAHITDIAGNSALVALYKILSPEHLLKLPFANDSNTLDKGFYGELLHIMGLTEVKRGGKKLIERNPPAARQAASLIEETISQLISLDKLSRIERPDQFGDTRDEQLFGVALELCISWINRVLFLKLLESQLISYHKHTHPNAIHAFAFLHSGKIKTYGDLNSLFFQVLACPHPERDQAARELFENVPYLNSTLFEPAELEQLTLFISNLRGSQTMPVFSQTVLKDRQGRKLTGNMPTLEYLFAFLSAYDFGGESTESFQEERKTLINASVLGLIFEKINGYKEGSFFTPGFITMYMCRETIRQAVVQKFSEYCQQNGLAECKVSNIEEVYELIPSKLSRQQANEIVNSVRICDPAVGSGHFLVSALNELIAIKNDLKILSDRNGKSLLRYEVTVANDELVVLDENGELFEYNPANKESQRVQEALFHEKQTLIENCLFGVDLNPNSVKICRLRLWIELLKNAYYIQTDAAGQKRTLETLPNIDINIKCGNSLVSRFAINADVKQALKNSVWNIDSYRLAVATYRKAENREQKREMEKLIAHIKSNFRAEIAKNDTRLVRKRRLEGELFALLNQTAAFEQSEKEKKEKDKKAEALTAEIQKLETEIEAVKNNAIFENAFEWRFEFPEVLNSDGEFVGFDVVIGNPPYFSISKAKGFAEYFGKEGFQTYSKGTDIYCLFYEIGGRLLKPTGHLTYITSNSWLRTLYGDLLKTHIRNHFQPVTLLNIEDLQVFDEATVESAVLALQKGTSRHPFPIITLSKDYEPGEPISEYIGKSSFSIVSPENTEWFTGGERAMQLKSKIEQDTQPLKQLEVKINFGIKTGYNEAFIIDEATKNLLINTDAKSAEIIKPVLRGRDLKKYSYEFSGQWVICTFPSLNLSIDDFPAIKRHFLSVRRERLEQSGEAGGRKKTSHQWFETQDSIAYWKEFEKPKLIWGEISDKPKFAYDDENYFAEATTFIMTGEHIKLLLAILNSRLSEWYFNLISTTTGMGTNRWKKYKIELFPIKLPKPEHQVMIEELVEIIISKKKVHPATDTSSYERQIDLLVYQLYGLNAEDIAYIEAEES